MEFYRSDKIRWPIAVIFDPIELGPGVYPEPEPDAYERFIYSRGIYAPLLDRERGRSSDGIRMLVKGRLGAGMDIDVSD